MSPFHPGEILVQARLGVRDDAERVGRIVGTEIPADLRPFLARQRMAVAASLDPRGRPWASLLTGHPGFIETVDAHLLRVSASPPADDPLAANLRGRGELGLLVIDVRTRQRMRFNGRGLALADGLFLLVEEVYGNCPKYIQKRRIVEDQDDPSDVARPGPVRTGSSLDVRQRALVASADTLFMATWHPQGGADASHRGGRPGFVRVLGDSTLELSDYPGNNMFNTLGNLTGHPRVGLLFVDFETGDLLQLTGRAQIRREPETTVRVEIEGVRETSRGSALRFALVEPSPANSPSRAVTEARGAASQEATGHEAQ